MNYNFKSRIVVISVCIIFAAIVMVAKLFYVQVIHGKSYTEEAETQYVVSAKDIFDRGNIFFSTKDESQISAASVITGFRLAIIPAQLISIEDTYAALSGIIPIDQEMYTMRANKKSDPYEEIATHITKENADKIQELKLPGVRMVREKWRFYPGGTLAAHALGFVAFKGDDFSGRYGLERQYNDLLSKQGDNLYVNFFAEVFSNITDSLFESKKKEGDIVTTIEPIVQSFIEKEIDKVGEAYQSDSVGAIIINPKTGEIYAMAAIPHFDLNDFSQVEDPRIFSNPFVENVFEFGSVIKPLAMAAAIDAGVLSKDTEYIDKGFVQVRDKVINNFDRKARGKVSMQEVLNQSLNTGMVYSMQLLGQEQFFRYMLSYGIGEKTGIDLPNETTSLVSNLKKGGMVEAATASFGQGIALTPVAAVRAFSVLANGGVLITPHLIKEVIDEDGSKIAMEWPVGTRVLSEETSDAITTMLVTVLDDGYGNGKIKLENYSVAAKTGTAQIALPTGGGYYDDRHLHSFFGYFPAYDPQFLVFLYNVNPKGVQYASQSLLPTFMETAKFLINYYDLPPDR